MKSEEHERAAELIAMLVRDPSARAAFRRRPADMCRDHGLDDVAEELAGRDGALQILDVRESRSSVAGVLIAAAAEGMAFFAFVDNAHAESGGGGLSPDVAHVVALTRPHLAAVTPEPGGGGGGAGGGGGGAADALPADAPAGGATVDTPVDAPAGGGAGGAVADQPVPDGGAATTPEPPAAGGQATPADAVPETGGGAAGGAPDLLHDPRLSLTDSAAQALGAEGPDSRTAEVLTALLARHTISVSAVAPDGSFTVIMVDGSPVDPANIAARDLVVELGALDPKVAPTAVGSPWSISGKQYYTTQDGQFNNHVQVGFGDPPPKPVVAAPAADPAPAAVAAPAPAADVTPGPAADVTPGPAADVTPGPAADVTPAPAAGVTPAPAGSGGTGGFNALVGSKPGPRGTLSLGAVHPDSSAAPAGGAAPAAGAAPATPVAADALAPLPGGVPVQPAGPEALAALAEAKKYLGTPYLWGGSKPSTGFDCSGLMQWAYHQAGINIDRVAAQQFHDGVPVDRAHLRAGDMVFFQDSTGYIHHVGMYIGDGKFIHAPHTGDVVKISSLTEPYYAHQFAGGRRMDTSAPVDAGGLQLDAVNSAPAAGGAAAGASVDAAAPAVAASAPPAAAHAGTGGFAALAAGGNKAAAPRATVQVLKAVQPPAAQPAGLQPAGVQPASQAADVQPGQGGNAHAAPPLSADQVAAAAAGGYPGDNAAPEQYAQWMAAAAQKAGLPPQLPIMAALTESGLRNLPGGDRDSMGFFQMRTSVWNHGEYAGYGQNPNLQLKWFIDQALAIKAQRLARGETAFQADPNQWGNWVADVERPQEDLRGRYQLHLAMANHLLGTSAGS